MSKIIRPARRSGWINQVSDRLLRGLPNRLGVEKDGYRGKRLNGLARAVGGWIEGRGDCWEMDPKIAQTILGISEGQWQRATKQLEEYGYMLRKMESGGRGKIDWDYIWLEPDSQGDGNE